MTELRIIPSIDELRRRPAIRALEARFGAAATVDALRAAAAAIRRDAAGGSSTLTSEDAVVDRIEHAAAAQLDAAFGRSLEPVLNATGVIVHTNLGRAPLAAVAIERVAEIGRGYSSLEYDLGRGARGRRDVHAESLLCRLTGAEAAIAVNNNAAATLLVLASLAAGREVIVSRGELVEIGGGFRIPDVMAQSGAVLREVGTTNKTRASDYAAAVSERTALILRVHPSNFRIEGFTERPAVAELVELGRRLRVPIAEDLGSGYLGSQQSRSRVATASEQGQTGVRAVSDTPETSENERADRGQSGVRHPSDKSRRGVGVESEPSVPATIAAGVDICCFSGDKLLGGPQAGLIVGRAELVNRARRHPLMRALRADKLTYAALEATLVEYAAGRAAATVPVQQMLTMTADAIRTRAETLARALADDRVWRADVIAGASTVGGGSAPGLELATWLVALERDGVTPDALEARLRGATPPVIARIEHNRVLLDLRTVAPDQDGTLLAVLRTAAQL